MSHSGLTTAVITLSQCKDTLATREKVYRYALDFDCTITEASTAILKGKQVLTIIGRSAMVECFRRMIHQEGLFQEGLIASFLDTHCS